MRIQRLICLFMTSIVLVLTAMPAAWADAPVQVKIEGIQGPLLDNVRSFLSIAGSDVPKKPPAELIRRLNARAPEEIRHALQPFGYYQPVIHSRLKKTGSNQWVATYRIQHGPPTRIRVSDVHVEGPGARALQSTVQGISLKPGERLVQSVYEDAKQELLKAAYNHGYLDADFSRHVIRVYPDKQVADIHLIMKTGPLYRFGHITIEQHILSQKFVQRFVTIPYGSPFDIQKLLNLQLALSDSGYFSRAEIDVQKKKAHAYQPKSTAAKKNPGRVVPVVIHTSPMKPQKYTAGVGYGTDTGPRVNGSIELRRLNRYGHSFQTNLELSMIRQALTAQYRIPIDNVAHDKLDFTVGAIKEDFGDGTSRRYTVGTDRLDRWMGFQRTVSLDFVHESYRFSSDTLNTHLLMPGITLSRTQSNRPVYPRFGYSISTNVHGADSQVLSSTNFIQEDTTLRGILPLGRRGRFLTRLEIGATAVSNFEKLPPSQRFFAGGARSVRGYAYQSLGPKNSNGDVVGGRDLLVGSAEVDYLVWGPYGVAAFIDAGNAFNHFPPNLKAGAGIGFRWKSPFGMVRLDFAHPLDNSRLVRVQFSFGPDL